MSAGLHAFSGNVAIAGIGATEFSKDSGRSELRLAVEAIDLALRDAGLAPSEVGGLVTFSADTNPDVYKRQAWYPWSPFRPAGPADRALAPPGVISRTCVSSS